MKIQKKNQRLTQFTGTYHLYLKKWPSIGADSGTSSVVTALSGRRKSTYGVSSQPTIGISDGRCTRSTLSMLLYMFHSWLSSPLCDIIKSASFNPTPTATIPLSSLKVRFRTRRRERLLPELWRTRGGSAIYLTRLPASLD